MVDALAMNVFITFLLIIFKISAKWNNFLNMYLCNNTINSIYCQQYYAFSETILTHVKSGSTTTFSSKDVGIFFPI